MVYEIYLTFHFEAKSSKSIDNTFNKIKKILEKDLELKILNIQNYSFLVKKEFYHWEKCVYEIIKLSQEIGRQWIILGTINFELTLWTNETKIIGVKNIEISCQNIEKSME